jgi:hypothetical protein
MIHREGDGTMDEVTRLAREAYAAYATTCAPQGHVPPGATLETLPVWEQEAWKAAVIDVQTEIHNQRMLALEDTREEATPAEEPAVAAHTAPLEAQLAALQGPIERLLAYWRTNRILDEEIDDCCGQLAEAHREATHQPKTPEQAMADLRALVGSYFDGVDADAYIAALRYDQDMEVDLAAWVKALGYDEVLSALITTCHYWATCTETPPIEGPNELWTKREHALRWAEWEAKR